MGVGGQGTSRPLYSREEPRGGEVPYIKWLGNISCFQKSSMLCVNSM